MAAFTYNLLRYLCGVGGTVELHEGLYEMLNAEADPYTVVEDGHDLVGVVMCERMCPGVYRLSPCQ